VRLFAVDGFDQAFSSALMAQRVQTLGTFLKMKLEPLDHAFMPTIDDFLNSRENTAVRKIMEQLLKLHGNSATFESRSAWLDLKQRWQALASTRHKRMAALKHLWVTTGGGRDTNSNPSTMAIIIEYYHKLFDQIETANNLNSLIPLLLRSVDPWSTAAP
jgi:hypothetical protein